MHTSPLVPSVRVSRCTRLAEQTEPLTFASLSIEQQQQALAEAKHLLSELIATNTVALWSRGKRVRRGMIIYGPAATLLGGASSTGD